PGIRTSPGACPWISPPSATGRTTSSSTRPARSSTRSPAPPPCRPAPTWHTACTTCASSTRSCPPPTSPSSSEESPMKLGAYTACLHDRPLDETLKILGELGLTSAEINTGGFIGAPHIPIDDILSSAGAREDYLGRFEQAGITLTGLNVNGNPLNPDP